MSRKIKALRLTICLTICAPPLTDIVSPPEETLTIRDGTDDIGAVSDDTAAHVSSEAKQPLSQWVRGIQRRV